MDGPPAHDSLYQPVEELPKIGNGQVETESWATHPRCFKVYEIIGFFVLESWENVWCNDGYVHNDTSERVQKETFSVIKYTDSGPYYTLNILIQVFITTNCFVNSFYRFKTWKRFRIFQNPFEMKFPEESILFTESVFNMLSNSPRETAKIPFHPSNKT